jgi:outer membrane protein insertion porin family
MVKDTSTVNSVNMLVSIDKGEKVKIKSWFVGNTKISDNTLRKTMKDTETKKITRVLKIKIHKDKYKTDLEK